MLCVESTRLCVESEDTRNARSRRSYPNLLCFTSSAFASKTFVSLEQPLRTIDSRRSSHRDYKGSAARVCLGARTSFCESSAEARRGASLCLKCSSSSRRGRPEHLVHSE